MTIRVAKARDQIPIVKLQSPSYQSELRCWKFALILASSLTTASINQGVQRFLPLDLNSVEQRRFYGNSIRSKEQQPTS